MNRRKFIANTSSFLSVPLLLRGLPIATAGNQLFYNAIEEGNDKILVLIQLNGGNDGLNTIIPLDKYDVLANVRPNIIIPQNDIIKINDTTGFHPGLTSLKSIFEDAKMTILQDVGYPNQNRSHFRSTDIWTSGSPADQVWTSGWLGRYLEGCHPDYPIGFPNEAYPDPFALTIGSSVSETCQGTITNFSLALTDPLSIRPLSNNATDEVPDTPYGRELAYLRTTIEQANAYGQVISKAAEKGSNEYSGYPDSRLAEQLSAIALLISGGLGTKIYVANLGGFDTHANQVETNDPREGIHASLMQTLAEAVFAFQQDLKNQGLEERVMTMTFSEFGRRIRSNGSLGTDHGTAAPMMFFGSCVQPGIIGESPLIPADPGVSDGVPMQFDFRSIYASILIDWFGIEQAVVNNILQDEFTYLPIVNACSQTTPTDDVPEITTLNVSNFPNPFENWTTISVESPGGNVRIALYDTLGNELNVITSRTLETGPHDIRFDGSHLVSGNYFCRVISERASRTFGMVKI